MASRRSFAEMDDPLVSVELHASTVDLMGALFRALEDMSAGGVGAFTHEQRSYLAQAMDIAADLDIVFSELASELERGLPLG